MGALEQAVRRQFVGLVKSANVKQDAIASAIGKSQSWLSQYLSAKRGSRATLDDLESLANYFDRSLIDILQAARQNAPATLSRLERWNALGKVLPDRDREHFEDTISAVVAASGNRARPRRTPAKNNG